LAPASSWAFDTPLHGEQEGRFFLRPGGLTGGLCQVSCESLVV